MPDAYQTHTREIDLQIHAQQKHPEVVADSRWRKWIGTRDGAAFTADWHLKQLMKGKIFQIAGGATSQGYSDEGTFGAGALDSDEFDLLMTIPAGKTVIPLQYTFLMQEFGTDGVLEILSAWGTGAVIGASAVTFTAVNQNTGSPKTSACTIVTCGDDGGTALTKEGEIWRDGLQNIDDVIANEVGLQPIRFEWKAFRDGPPPIIEGARFIAGWAAVTAGKGFQKFTWAEFDTGEELG